MSFFDTYTNILKQKGGNVNNSDIRNSENAIIRQFKNDKSYNLGILKKSDFSEEEIDTRVVNNSNKTEEKFIYLLPKTKVDIGSYIYYKDIQKHFLITEYEYNLLSPFGIAKICNQNFKWQDDYGIHEFPCYCKNDSYGVSTSSSSDLLSNSEAKLKIYLQFNEEIARVKKNTRLIFNSRETDIYKIIDISTVTEKGLLIMTCENDVYRSQSDNLINNLADNSDLYNKQDVDEPIENPKSNEEEEDNPTPNKKEDYKIIGQDKIKHKNSYTYTLSPINNNFIWELDEDSVELEVAEMIEQSNEKCVIYANEVMTNETIILYAKDKINNNILAQKEITIIKK